MTQFKWRMTKETRNPNNEGTSRPTAGRSEVSFRASSLVIRPSSFAALAAAVLVALSAFAATNGAPSRNLGIEGRATFELPSADYRPRPLDDRTELMLHIEAIAPLGKDRFRYEFHYLGFEPGQFNLVDFLVRPDGSRPAELGELPITVRSLLPEEHDGKLTPHVPRPFPWIGGYRLFLGVLALVWLGGLAWFAFGGRRKPAPAPVVAAPPTPSLADRLRPLVEAAAAGKLGCDGQAQLERLLLGHWREKLGLADARVAEAVLRLKQHAEAGLLLRALEGWLHRPGGATGTEVLALLEPYRRVPAPETGGGA
jgi:hypothetical protein